MGILSHERPKNTKKDYFAVSRGIVERRKRSARQRAGF
jgi:hypothetical protein